MIDVEQRGSVTIVAMDRPAQRNAVDGATAEALAAAFRAFEANPTSHVAILYGRHGTFSAGADLKAIASGTGANRTMPDGDGPMGPTRMQLSKPVIAAVSGHAVAGGMELACWCDLRVVEESAVFGVFCRRWGVPLIDGGTLRLPRLIGLSRALDLILTGRPVSAAEALAMGLANRVVPDGTALDASIALAEQIGAFPQACLRADRESAYYSFAVDQEAALRAEFDRGAAVLSEAVTGAARFARGEGRHGTQVNARNADK